MMPALSALVGLSRSPNMQNSNYLLERAAWNHGLVMADYGLDEIR